MCALLGFGDFMQQRMVGPYWWFGHPIGSKTLVRNYLLCCIKSQKSADLTWKMFSKCRDNIKIDIEETACERYGPDLTRSGELNDRLLRTRDRRD